MAAADVSGLIEAASSPDLSPSSTTAVVDTPIDETPIDSTPSDDTTAETPAEGDASPTASPGATEPDSKVDARTNPDAIRKALKSWRDSMPENDPGRQIPRQLNDIVGREKAFRDVFPKVSDAKQAKFLLDSIGGGDGLTSLQATIKSVNETDSLLHAGDGRVVKNIYEDMKAAGKGESFGKLASPFLEQLQEVDPKAYASTLRPHLVQHLVAANLPGVLEGLSAALSAVGADNKPAPNIDALKHLVGEITRWFGEEKKAVDGMKKTSLDPDRQAFEKRVSDFESGQKKAFETEVHGDWNKLNNQSLGEALRPYLKLPFAKNWTDATKTSVAREITQTLLGELASDKSYQSQMDAYWSDAKPEKSKIINFHKGKLDLVAKRIVKDVLDARYPGFASVKGAPVAAKPNGAARPHATPAAGSPAKPIFQSTMPKPTEVNWDKTSDTLFATGRFFDQKGILRTWNQRYK